MCVCVECVYCECVSVLCVESVVCACGLVNPQEFIWIIEQ